MTHICVYCASSEAVAPGYFEVARALGAALGQRGDTLVYGGSDVGLMRVLARATHEHGGRVIGVIPRIFKERGIAYAEADELVLTNDLRERKAIMEARAEAFVALPGGFGTLDEVAEVLLLRQLGLHTKPIVLLNQQDYYAPLLALFEHFYDERFAKPYRAFYHAALDVADVFAYLDTYQPADTGGKWFSSQG